MQGKVAGLDITKASGESGSGINITLRGNRYTNNTLDGRLFGNLYVDWEIIEGLKFKSVLGVDNQSRRTGTYEDYMCTANYQFGRGSSFSALNSESFGYTFENTLNYTFTLSGKQLRHI